MADHILRREVRERKAVADTELEQLRVKEWRAYEQCNAEFHKQERYCKEQREVLRALARLYPYYAAKASVWMKRSKRARGISIISALAGDK